MRPFHVLAAGLGLLVCACGPAASGSLGHVPSGSAPSAGATAPPPSGTAQSPPASAPLSPSSTPTSTRTVSFQAWFIRSGKLFATQRTESYSQGIGQLALRTMLGGVSAAEASAGLGSNIPAGTRLLRLSVAGGTATVDLSSAFDAGSATPAIALRLAQVVYTITQFSSVNQVRFEIDGQVRTAIGGVTMVPPQSRARYAALLPAITVSSPVIGGQVTSPVTVSGMADVFEAVVSLRILDSSGHEIARAFTNASCGTGCRGDYSVTVPYSVIHTEPGTIQVFEVSAKSGLPVNVQSIPVMLHP